MKLFLKDGDDAQFFTEHHCLELYSSSHTFTHMGSHMLCALPVEKGTHLACSVISYNIRFLNIALICLTSSIDQRVESNSQPHNKP